jgi:hypothetical protein
LQINMMDGISWISEEHLTCTEYHKFLLQGEEGRIPAAELKIGDRLR